MSAEHLSFIDFAKIVSSFEYSYSMCICKGQYLDRHLDRQAEFLLNYQPSKYQTISEAKADATKEVNARAAQYSKLYEEARFEKHPFVKELNDDFFFKSATEKFLSKKVMADVPFIIRRQADLKLLTPPLPNLFFLYLIAAEAIELSHQIDIEGTIRFIKGAEQKRIEQKASMAKRLEAIAFELTDQLTSENADQVYEHHVNSLVREIRDFIEHQDLRLNFSFIQRRYDRYFIAKDHGSAKRQILTNFLIHRYASTFIVQTQTFSKKDSSTSIYKRQQRKKSFAGETATPPYRIDPSRVWRKKNGYIHADVIVELLAMINGDDGIDVRQIQRARQEFYGSLTDHDN